MWEIELRGGPYDGMALYGARHEPLLVAWMCWAGCEGHGVFDPNHPAIVMATAQAYRRVEVHADERRVVYEVGDMPPGREELAEDREMVAAHADEGSVALGLLWAVPPTVGAWAAIVGSVIGGGVL